MINPMLKLYYTPMSLNSRRVWVALLEKQIGIDISISINKNSARENTHREREREDERV